MPGDSTWYWNKDISPPSPLLKSIERPRRSLSHMEWYNLFLVFDTILILFLSNVPSKAPSNAPSEGPYAMPSQKPSNFPSDIPSVRPSHAPSDSVWTVRGLRYGSFSLELKWFIQQDGVSFVRSSVWYSGTIDHWLVASGHVANVFDRNVVRNL